jgi:hypothetical protein
MRTTELILMLSLAAIPATAQQPIPAPAAAPSNATAQSTQTALHQSAVKFVEASDTRQRLEQNLDRLLDDGKQSLMKRDPLLNPKFADEWEKRMRKEVNLDEFVDATARVYEKYYTSEELDQLTQAQLARKQGKPYFLPPQLAEKLKSNSAQVQSDINTETSQIGSRQSIAVGQEIEKDHPDWVKPAKPRTTTTHKS